MEAGADFCLVYISQNRVTSGKLTGIWNIHQCVDVFPNGKKRCFQVAY